MVEFMCPECGGGFDRPRYEGDDEFCPWCDQAIDGSYEYKPPVSIARTRRDDEDRPRNILDIFR